MKPKNMKFSNVCKAIARENKMKVEYLNIQVAFLLTSIHKAKEEEQLNAIYHSYRYAKPTEDGFSKIVNSGRPFTMDDRVNYINGFIDATIAAEEGFINEDNSKQALEMLAGASSKELVAKYGKEYGNPSRKYIVGLRDGYKVYKKSK